MNDGGSAFPVLEYEYKATGDLHPSPTMQCGMSLRDWFAGMALQGIIAGLNSNPLTSSWTPEGNVVAAYEYADAMLEERNK